MTETHSPEHAHGGQAPASHATHAHAKQAPPTTSRAWMIGGILLLFILIVGVLVFTKLTAPTPDEHNGEGSAVQIKLLVDANCVYCFKTNTILAKLDQSHVKYTVQTIDVRSDEGKALVEEFGIEYAPTALIHLQGLDQNSEIQAALQGQFIKNPAPVVKGWVVFAERFLDSQPRLITFLEAPNACTVTPGKISLMAHMDYGDCTVCVDAYNRIQALEQKYPSLHVEYVPILYNRSTPSKLLGALNANKGAVCAERLGYLEDYTTCNYFYSPGLGNLDINYMQSCIREAGASVETTRNQFASCVRDRNSGAESTLVDNTLNMHEWNPLKYTPSFVLDCQYSFVGHGSLESYICSLHPELANCPALTIDQNALAIQDINAPAPPSLNPGQLVDVNTNPDANA